jgi:hypothetical protein
MAAIAVKTLAAHLKGQRVAPQISTGEYLATPENMDRADIRVLLEPHLGEE